MRKNAIGAVVAVAVFAGLAGSAVAQGNITISIAPEDQPKITNWVKAQNKPAVRLPPDVSLNVGAVIPRTVTLYTFGPDVGVQDVKGFYYGLLDGKTVIIEPTTRKVVQILD